MAQHRSDSSKMRVAVVSASRNQREHLKRLIENYGPTVIGVSGFRDYNATVANKNPDVLLIDLDQADDAALDRMEKLVEQSKIPILFNESTAIPMMPGPYRDDWVDNLVGKLYSLAQKHEVAAAPALLDRPRYSNTTGRHAMPKVLVVSHSKTRRRVLQIILAAQGIKETAETDYAAADIRDKVSAYDLLLLDEHNVGPEDATTFEYLLAQSAVPAQLCNSSHIPHAPSERNQWGAKLAGKLIKLAKSADEKLSVEPANEPQADEHWGERIANTLSGVRETIKNTPSLHESVAAPKTTKKTSASGKGKREVRSGTSTLSITAKKNETEKDYKYRPPVKLNRSVTNEAVNEVPALETTESVINVEFEQPVDRYSKRPTSRSGAGDIVDASNIGAIASGNAPEKSVASLTQDERDAEIARFFNFDTPSGERPDLAMEPLQQAPAVKITTKTKKAAPSPREQPPSKNGARSKKSIKQWFQSLTGIRQKLPKLFN